MGSHRDSTDSSSSSLRFGTIQSDKKWVPPPEPHKPYLPYKRGFKFKIHRHTPVQPFGSRYASYCGERREVRQSKLVKTTLVELCNAYPPMEGITDHDHFRELEVIEKLEVKDGRGAQLFVCCLDGEVTEYVAKVYDPLYYGFANLMWSDLPRDVTYAADGDYSREVAAYEYLNQQSFHSPEVPTYHSSWTFDLPTDIQYTDSRTGNHTRPVRMILMEHIDGRTMLDMNVARTPPEHRLDVLSRVMETESKLRHIGLNHNDVSQRNVMVCGYDSIPAVPMRVCLFDFNVAVIIQRSTEVVEKGIVVDETRLPISPVDLWWGRVDYEFGNWLPEDWNGRSREWHRWLLDRYRDSKLFEPPETGLAVDEELSVPVGADGRPYDDFWTMDDYVPNLPSISPSPGLGGIQEPPDQQRLSGGAAQSPKRNWSDFVGDGVDNDLELRNQKTVVHTPDSVFGTEDLESGSLKQHIPQSPRFQPVLGHMSLGVKDYDLAKSFFAALKPLGLKLVYDSEDEGPSFGTRTLGYGPDMMHELLNIFEYGEEAHAPGRGCHIAFNAPSREAVDEFHKYALIYGGTCDGKPGVRSRYGPYYYAAFVISPEGWRLEAVCKNPL